MITYYLTKFVKLFILEKVKKMKEPTFSEMMFDVVIQINKAQFSNLVTYSRFNSEILHQIRTRIWIRGEILLYLFLFICLCIY